MSGSLNKFVSQVPSTIFYKIEITHLPYSSSKKLLIVRNDNLGNHIMQYIFFIFRMMEDSSSKCSVGLVKEEVCHKISYAKQIGLINFKDIESLERQIMLKRSGIQAKI